MSAVAFRVYGVAQQKGSTRAFAMPLKGHTKPDGSPVYRAVTTSANPNLKGWEQLVARAASDAIAAQPGMFQVFAGPVRLAVRFYLPRPKYAAKKNIACTTSPDLDKLVRAVKDALAQVVYGNDSQVVDLIAQKFYTPLGTGPETAPHVDVHVEETPGLEQSLLGDGRLFA